MITRLHIRNVKETADEQIALSQHNIVIGGWGSGKTTIADALQFAVNGKPLSDLYTGAGHAVVFDALCTGGHSEMSVALTSDTMSFTRALTKSGTIKQELEIDDGPTGVQKCAQIIEKKLGRAIFDVRVLRDDPETVKRVLLSRCSFDGHAAYHQIVRECLRGLTDAFLGENWLEHYADFNGFALESATPEQEQAMLEAARAKLKGAGVDEVDTVLPASAAAFAQGDLIGKLLDSITMAGEKRKDATRDMQAAKKAVAAIAESVTRETASTTSLQGLRESLKQKQEQLDAHIRRKGEIEGRLHAAAGMIAAREKYQNRIEHITNVELPNVERISAETQEQEHAEKYTEDDHAQALLVVDVAKRIEDTLELCEACVTKVGGYRKKKEQLVKRIRIALDKLSAVRMTVDEVGEMRNKLESERARLQERLAEFDAESECAIEPVPQELHDLIHGLRASIEADRAELERLVAHKTRKENYEAQQVAIKEYERIARVYGIVEDALKACYDDMVQSALAPVEKAVTDALRRVAKDWTFYLELDARGRLVFGVDKPVKGQRGKRCKTPYRALSGAESVFTRTVLGAVLLTMNDCAEKILVDELAELPVELVGDFLATIQSTCKNVQCLYMTCHAAVRDVVPDGWNIIDRGTTVA